VFFWANKYSFKAARTIRLELVDAETGRNLSDLFGSFKQTLARPNLEIES
jgi:hypothetical protein